MRFKNTSIFENFDLKLTTILLRLGLIVVVYIFGRSLAGLSRRWLTKSLKRYELTESLITLLVTLVYYSILVLTFAIVLAILGVPPNIIVGAIGLMVIVLAITLQASLGNLAAMVNFLLFKPYVVGDFIQTAGIQGAVQEIQLFSTVIVSPNHKTHILLNGKIQGAGISNLSKLGTDRADQAFRISYTSDFESGALGNVSGVCPCDYGYDARVEIIGKKGIMQIGEMKGQAVVVCVNRDQGLITPIYRRWPERFAWAYIHEIEHFVACVRSGEKPRVGGEDGRWAVAMVLAGTKSFLEERPVTLKEVMI